MKQKILIIDDEPDLLRLLERIISRKRDYEIITTNNSLEVPHILEDNEFDVVCTDFKMPGMDGMEILKLINESNRFEQVIMITAFGSLESAMDALSKGVFDYITKPFKKEQILFTVDRAMRYQKNARQAQQISSIFEITPFEDAIDAFKKEYVGRLNELYEGNKGKILQLSGLTEQEIIEFIK